MMKMILAPFLKKLPEAVKEIGLTQVVCILEEDNWKIAFLTKEGKQVRSIPKDDVGEFIIDLLNPKKS